MSWTSNELKVLNFLVRHFSENYSINQLAKQIGITPKGMHKLLKRLEKQGVLLPRRMANAVFYELNFSSDLARKAAEISLFEDIRLPFARVQAKDLEVLRQFVRAAVLFGSVLEKGEKSGDIDVLVIVEKRKYAAFQNALNRLQHTKPKRIQPVLQSPEDFIKNLKKQDKIVLEILKTGKILWGHDTVINSIKTVVEHGAR